MRRKMWKRLVTFVLAFSMILTYSIPGAALGAVDTAASPFTDIDGHWAEADIIEAVEAGYVSGATETTFEPNEPITRAEFVKMINNAFGLEAMVESESFADVDESDWFYDDIRKAEWAGYIQGQGENTFAPNVALSRAEAAVIFGRLVPNYGMHDETEVSAYPDFTELSWAEDALTVSYNKGYIQGYPDKTLQPRGTLTRAEALTVVLRIVRAETINHESFTADDKGVYENTIYTGVITVPKNDTATFNNCVILNTLKSGNTEAKTDWTLDQETAISNFEYATSTVISGGGGGGTPSKTSVQLGAPDITVVKDVDGNYYAIGKTSTADVEMTAYKITLAQGENEPVEIGNVKIDQDTATYYAELAP